MTTAGQGRRTGQGRRPAKDDDRPRTANRPRARRRTTPTARTRPTARRKPVGPERWEAFASAPEPRPSIFSRAGRAVGRFLIHEWTLAALGALALAVLMTWPTLRYPRYTLPQDTGTRRLQAWQMAWAGHILLTDPARLWHSNAFFPEL